MLAFDLSNLCNQLQIKKFGQDTWLGVPWGILLELLSC